MLRYRKLFFVIILLAFCLSISLQCSDDAVAPEPDPEPPTQNSVSKTIDQNGGTVALDSEAWVIIPPGALDSALVITITRIADALNPPANYISRGASYGFTPHSYTFNDSVTIGITYEPDTVLAAPSMVKLDSDADNSWETVPGARCVAGTVIYKSLTFSILSVNSFQPLEEVYVSIFSQGPSAAGTRGDPLPTISAGIAAAQGAGQPYPPVLVATGTYEESLVLADGVSIQGGLDPETWEFPAEPIEYSVVDLNTTAASAAGITHTTSIAGLVLSADDAVSHLTPNSIALRVVNCREGLRFVNCRFIAGNGRDGNEGPKGFDGVDGGAGQPSGRNGTTIYNGNWMLGGPGGYSGMYAGGKGGNATYAGCGYQGGHGQGNKVAICGGGCGGVGAFCGGGLGSFGGGNGPNGANGANGACGTNEGVFANGWWQPTGAGSGTHGEHGCGGGGGGGGVKLGDGGLGGGGGGGGGTRGGGGGGAMGGGSSFAVFLWESSPVFVNCEFIVGNGGHGGKGGDGGNRGAGSAGGICYASTNFWIKGGNGGTGGNGGFGGSGGGGAGGHSFCVYRYGNVCLNADFSGCNPWDWYPGAPGLGGDGGQASNNIAEGPQADRGDDGKAGLIGPE